MALAANAITTVEKAKAWLRIDDTIGRDAISIYHDGTSVEVSATVEVTETTIIGESLAGAPANLSITFAAQTTVSAMVTAINAVAGWVAKALYHGDALTADMVPKASTACFLQAQLTKLRIEETRGLELIIDGVTAEIETFLDRGIASRTYTEDIFLEPGYRLEQVMLREPDISSLDGVRIDSLIAASIQYTGADAKATVEVTETGVVTRSWASGVEDEDVSLFADNVTLAAMKTAVETDASWSMTIGSAVDSTLPSDILQRDGARPCKARPVNLRGWEDYDGEYSLRPLEGGIDFRELYWPFSSTDRISTRVGLRRMQASYTAGFSTVPPDIEQVALEMIESEYERAGRDENILSETLGPYSYTLAGDLPQQLDWQQRIKRYSRDLI